MLVLRPQLSGGAGSLLRSPQSLNLALNGSSKLQARCRPQPCCCCLHTSRETSLVKAAKKKKTLVPPTAIPPPAQGPIKSADVFQNGVLLMDKSAGWTSFDVVAKVRGMLRPFGVKKVGHAGTLDPEATGLLVVCTGKGTKSVDTFVAQEKEYVGTMRLGEATATYDAESEPDLVTEWEHVTDEMLEDVAGEFTGDLQQVPPMFSAVKINGQALYKAARRGEVTDRPARPVTVHSFRLWRSTPGSRDVHYHVKCSKGTYVRSLVHDVGLALSSAAHVRTLRRASIGLFRVEDAWHVEELQAEINRLRDAAGLPLPVGRRRGDGAPSQPKDSRGGRVEGGEA